MIETQNQLQIDDQNGNSTKPLLPAVFSLDVIIPYMENTTEESWCEDVVKTKDGKNCLFGHLFDLGGGELFDWFENKILSSIRLWLQQITICIWYIF